VVAQLCRKQYIPVQLVVCDVSGNKIPEALVRFEVKYGQNKGESKAKIRKFHTQYRAVDLVAKDALSLEQSAPLDETDGVMVESAESREIVPRDGVLYLPPFEHGGSVQVTAEVVDSSAHKCRFCYLLNSYACANVFVLIANVFRVLERDSASLCMVLMRLAARVPTSNPMRSHLRYFGCFLKSLFSVVRLFLLRRAYADRSQVHSQQGCEIRLLRTWRNRRDSAGRAHVAAICTCFHSGLSCAGLFATRFVARCVS